MREHRLLKDNLSPPLEYSANNALKVLLGSSASPHACRISSHTQSHTPELHGRVIVANLTWERWETDRGCGWKTNRNDVVREELPCMPTLLFKDPPVGCSFERETTGHLQGVSQAARRGELL